jgi:hypothetical protein
MMQSTSARCTESAAVTISQLLEIAERDTPLAVRQELPGPDEGTSANDEGTRLLTKSSVDTKHNVDGTPLGKRERGVLHPTDDDAWLFAGVEKGALDHKMDLQGRSESYTLGKDRPSKILTASARWQ